MIRLEAAPPAVPPAVHSEPRVALVKSQNRDRRHSRYEQVMELARRGMSKLQIGRELGDRQLFVARGLREGGFDGNQHVVAINRHLPVAQPLKGDFFRFSCLCI